MSSKTDLAIVGWHDGGAGQIEAWLTNDPLIDVKCFVNPLDKAIVVDVTKIDRDAKQFSYPKGTSFKGKPLLNGEDWPEQLLKNGVKEVLITTPNLLERHAQIVQARRVGLTLFSAIHPSAQIAEDALLGENLLIYPRVFIGYRTEIQNGVSVNTGSQIDHHNVIRDCVALDPGVITAGNVTIGEYSQIHTGAVIINRLRIGKNATVGAGAVVIKDVKDGAKMVGVPAREIS